MEQIKHIFNNAEKHMDDTYHSFKHKLEGLNVGRATPELLSNVKVDAYNNVTPLIHLANISVPEPRLLVVNVWDRALVSSVDSAIRAANLGFNPVVDGNMLKIHIPVPTEERRKELIKIASGFAESAKVAIKKTHRRDAIDAIEEVKKTGGLSEDEYHSSVKKLEAISNSWVLKVEDLFNKKTKELKTI